MFTRLADLVDALTRSKLSDLNLLCQHGHLIIVEQRKEWYLPQFFCLASHSSPPLVLSYCARHVAHLALVCFPISKAEDKAS
jgi:hypothetical protein